MCQGIIKGHLFTGHEVGNDHSGGPRYTSIAVDKHAAILSGRVNESKTLVKVDRDVSVRQVKDWCVLIYDVVSVHRRVSGQAGHIEDMGHVVLGKQGEVSSHIL